MLYIVATPIGNLEDITLRAINVLRDVDLILCEDTREILKLLNHLDIKKPLLSYYKDNETRRLKKALELLLEGKDIALVSDRGTPGISDPAYLLVREAYRFNIKVVPVPGASAITVAMSACGLPSDRFSFYGFIPRKKNRKMQFLVSLIDKEETLVFFESVHRIKDTLALLNSLLPEREMALCRELTKKFEEIKVGTVSSICEEYSKTEDVRGEFVLIIKGRG
ncbi:MAG TPA: 16S rRNA (cytidine(1402)-2'-O)-methyltransferase [bacterium]|nr:16S rRNA (cytidine(1402)-2'-O)-methyltransferase [bacterium]